jgi:long-chain acyl-CoA synthetase
VELMVALEERFHSSLDESGFANARNVGDIQALLAAGAAPPDAGRRSESTWSMPSWNRQGLVSLIRRASLAVWLLPLTRLFARIRVEGLEHVAALEGPVVFASNHQSLMDTPVILAALPGHWRRRVAVAMAKEFFDAHFHPKLHSPRERFTSGSYYGLAAFFFNAFPLPQREAGTRQALRYIGDLIGEGWSVLIYPEGERSDSGEIGGFRPGIGMIGARLSVPVVPIRLEGVDRVLHKSWKMARRGRVRVAFGPPLDLDGEDYANLARAVESAVRGL